MYYTTTQNKDVGKTSKSSALRNTTPDFDPSSNHVSEDKLSSSTSELSIAFKSTLMC
jgi:hypothetical protein